MRRTSVILGLILMVGAAGAEEMAQVDMPGVVGHNDVIYQFPAREGWEGMPLGNGTLGAMAWQPDGMLFQLNTPLSGVYGGAICRVRLRTINPMLTRLESYRQRLSLYEAALRTEITSETGKLRSECFIPADTDALVLTWEDLREGEAAAMVEVETWRPEARHYMDDGLLVITDKLQVQGEPDYRFAVVVGGQSAAGRAEIAPESATSRLRTGGGKQVVWVAFAGTRDPETDVVVQAREKLAALRRRGLEAVRRAHNEWWADFWSKSFVKLTSEDGAADYVANLWYMHLYAMGAGSRGEVPPKFNGGLWTDNRDEREWGTSFWHWNTQETYWPVYAANHLELLAPYYDMYWKMLPTVQQTTKEFYGIDDAAQYQETIPFNGRVGIGVPVMGIHPRLPVPKEVNATNQIYSSSAEIAMQYWWHYLYTGDEQFLRERTYPLMKAVANFFLAYLEKDADGVYHMYPSSGHETFHNKLNATTDLAAIRYLFPTLIRASEILGQDAELRPVWQEHLDHLAPYGLNEAGEAITPYYLEPGEKLERQNAENPELFPIGVFPLIKLGSPDLELGIRTFHNRFHVNGYGWTTDSICAARLGLGDSPEGEYPPQQMGIVELLPLHAEYYQNYPCGLQDYYGRQPGKHPYLEGSGTLSTGVGEMLLQSWDGVIRVCPALPKDWSADFKLLAQGGFEVTGHADKRGLMALELLSLRGQPVKLANPFGAKAMVTVDRRAILTSEEPVLSFPTQAGKRYLVVRFTQSALPQYKVTAAVNDAPKHLGPDSKRWIGKPVGLGQTWQPPVEPNAPQPPAATALIDRPANPPAVTSRFAAAPTVDGELDEAEWQAAESLGPFLLLGKHTPATEQTDVYLGYDDENLYVGMVCWESRMAGQMVEIKGTPENRDRAIYQDDSVEFFLVPPGQAPWHFGVNALGARYDGRGWTAAQENPTVNPEWTVATSRHSNRWIVEAALPFSSLAPEGPYDGEQWGVNFGRNEKPLGELSTWAPLTQTAFHLAEEFGRLTFTGRGPAPPMTVADTDLVGRWDFAQRRGQWVLDSSGHRHGGLLTSPMRTVPGKWGQALEMTGTGYVEIAPTPALDLVEGMTLALWVNPARVSSMRLVDKGPAGGSASYLLDTHPANNLRLITGAGGLNSAVTLPVGEWSHVAVTYDGTQFRMYLNGELVAEGGAGPRNSVTDLPLRLGADSTGWSRFVGLMEDVRVYRRALSQEELREVVAGR